MIRRTRHRRPWISLIAAIVAATLITCGVEASVAVIPTQVPTVLPSPIVPPIARAPGGARAEQSVPATPTPPGSWIPTAPPGQPRSSHVAVLLQDGRVLVAGGSLPTGLFRALGGRILGITGRQGGDALASTEIYDPDSETWSDAGALATPRLNATVTLLQNGKVLVAGGENGGDPLSSAEIFDPESETWSVLPDMASAHTLHTATLLPDGRVMIAAGNQGDLSARIDTGPVDAGAVEFFDPEAMAWSSGPPLPQGPLQIDGTRVRHAAVLLDESHVLVSGGLAPDGRDFNALQTALLLDLEIMEWTAIDAMVTRRQGHALTGLPGGRILASGGASQNPRSEIYYPDEDIWRPSGTNSLIREGPSVTVLADGRVIMVGGRSSFRQLDSSEIFNSETEEWSLIPAMAERRLATTATTLADGRVLVVGGAAFTENRRLENSATAEIYDPEG